MLKFYLSLAFPGLFLRMAEETPAVTIEVNADEETARSEADAAAEIQRAADATLDTAKEIAREMVWSADEKARVISELQDLRNEVRDLAARNAEQHGIIVAMLEDIGDSADDAADEAADAADAAAAAAVTAAETPEPEIAAAAQVAAAAGDVAQAAAEESKPVKRKRGWL